MTLACPECGAHLAEQERLIDTLQARNEYLQDDNVILHGKVKRNRSDQADHQSANADEVMAYWRDRLFPDARSLNGSRGTMCDDRLKEDYTVTDLKRCIDGYANCPASFTYGRDPKGRFDAEYIFRSARNVDQGLAFYDRTIRQLPGRAVDPTKLSFQGQRAVALAAAGVAIFPIVAGAKNPVPGTHGLLDATRDPERIARYWMKVPDANIGARCGVPSDLVVLDVDGDDGAESLRALEREHGTLPETYSVVTPRGGQHYYFRHPTTEIRNTAGYPGVGLDIRGDGGYVLVPPSSIGGRAYEVDCEAALAEMPRWLVKLLLERQAAESGEFKDYQALVRDGASKGERDDDLLTLVGHLWGREEENMVLEIALAVNDARCRPPLARRQVKKIVASVAKMRARDQAKLLS